MPVVICKYTYRKGGCCTNVKIITCLTKFQTIKMVKFLEKNHTGRIFNNDQIIITISIQNTFQDEIMNDMMNGFSKYHRTLNCEKINIRYLIQYSKQKDLLERANINYYLIRNLENKNYFY